jgi:hypothetical protein
MVKKDPPSTSTSQQPQQWEALRTGKKPTKKDSSSTPKPQQPQQWEAARKGNPKQKAAQEEYYNSINFKNKDIDRFSKRFANGESQAWEGEAVFGKKTYTPDQINALNKQKP